MYYYNWFSFKEKILEERKEALESKSFIGRSKTKYIKYDYGEREHRANKVSNEVGW